MDKCNGSRNGAYIVQMLQAITANKAGRSIESKEVHWREIFTSSEDSLTSTIFGNLLHLPRSFFWEVLLNASYNKINIKTGKILSVDFWPHWKTFNVNRKFVEPDMFIRTSDFDLIVEAKRWDDNQQNLQQWKEEFHAYLTEYGNDDKQVYLLAIGGISNEAMEEIIIAEKRIKIIKCRWMRLLQEMKGLERKIKCINHIHFEIDSVSAIINDIILGFRIHGYAVGEWFETISLNGLEIKTENIKM